MNILGAFLSEAERHSGRTALTDGAGRAAAFGDLLAGSARLAAAWRAKGLGAGERVLLAMPLGIGLYMSLAALWRLGAVAVFPEPALGIGGLRHAIRTAQPRAFLASGWYRTLKFALPELWRVPLSLTPRDGAQDPRGDSCAEVAADHPALISFTSGSTGAPKAIVRSHGFLAAQNACVAGLLRPEREGEIDLVAFPVFVVANLGLGVTSVLPNWNLRRHDRAAPAAIRAHIERHGVTRALLPPSICEKLAGDPPAGLHAVFTGGGPVFPDLLQRLGERLPGTDIVTVYGSTEAEPIAYVHLADIAPADWTAMRAGAGLLAGKPTPETQVRIIGDEIAVTGDHVNKGYLDPGQDAGNKLRIDGSIWHRTGDAGRLDAEGRLWLLGRCEGRAGGFYPFAVEIVARSWPGVRGAALAEAGGRAIIAIEGSASQRSLWQALAGELGDLSVAVLDRIPRDKRHRSKVDYPALRRLLN